MEKIKAVKIGSLTFRKDAIIGYSEPYCASNFSTEIDTIDIYLIDGRTFSVLMRDFNEVEKLFEIEN